MATSMWNKRTSVKNLFHREVDRESKGEEIMTMNSSPKIEHRGYVFDFVGKVSAELVCKLCSKVLREPVQVVCCGQHYCKQCIERRTANSSACPSCHTSHFNHFNDKHFEQRINQLKVYCPHHKRGCKWTGEMSTVQSHLHASQGCPYEAVLCANKCGQTMMRRDLKDHLHKHCPLRRVRCQYCNHENSYQVVTGPHYAVCPNYPVKCSYNCNTKGVRRADLGKHEQQCTMKPVTCPFTGAGCKVQLVQKDLEDHIASYTGHHLDLVTKSFDAFKTRADTAERQIHIAQAEIEDLKKDAEAQHKIRERTMHAIAKNSEELLANCTDNQKFAVQSIQALCNQSQHSIRDINSPLTFQMVNYSEYKRSGKVWYSSPFYVAGGYKMCLAAHASGMGSGQGSFLSISLCLMRGEFDNELTWPVELPFHLAIEIIKQGDEFDSTLTSPENPSNPKTYIYFHYDSPQERLTDDVLLTEARKCENFASHDLVENRLLYYDAITFRITAESEFL